MTLRSTRTATIRPDARLAAFIAAALLIGQGTAGLVFALDPTARAGVQPAEVGSAYQPPCSSSSPHHRHEDHRHRHRPPADLTDGQGHRTNRDPQDRSGHHRAGLFGSTLRTAADRCVPAAGSTLCGFR